MPNFVQGWQKTIGIKYDQSFSDYWNKTFTVKFLKTRTPKTKKFAVITLKFEQDGFTIE